MWCLWNITLEADRKNIPSHFDSFKIFILAKLHFCIFVRTNLLSYTRKCLEITIVGFIVWSNFYNVNNQNLFVALHWNLLRLNTEKLFFVFLCYAAALARRYFTCRYFNKAFGFSLRKHPLFSGLWHFIDMII